MENNLSETAFFVPTEQGYHIRWFTPTTEVKLCGHATLASAYVIFNELAYAHERIVFDSLSGPLTVTKRDALFELDFPAQPPLPCETPGAIVTAFQQTPIETLKNEDYIVVFEHADAVLNAKPDIVALKELDLRGVAITAPGIQGADFICRFFAPNYGIDEDPVTGSAYTQLAPYWAERLGKKQMHAKQVSRRGGDVFCCVAGDRVEISGGAVKYMEGLSYT